MSFSGSSHNSLREKIFNTAPLAMNFDSSTQARSWVFDEDTLAQCREKVISERSTARKADGSSKVRKFASGYHHCHDEDIKTYSTTNSPQSPSSGPCDLFEALWAGSTLSSNEQDVLVRFHAHQLTMLIGPAAILPSLVRSPTVLATAIVLLRRFYLSNSVLDFKPRKMAVAAAFLAAKIEEQKVEVDILEHATDLIQQRVKGAPLCRQELSYVTVEEIEAAERDLMEGINYEMICHHPYNAVRVLSGEVENFLSLGEDRRYFPFERRQKNGESSPRKVFDIRGEDCEEGIQERAIMIAQNALLFSDLPFIFPPGHIAFAAVAMAIRKKHDAHGLPLTLRTYLRDRFVSKTEEDLLTFEDQVSNIVDKLVDSPVMDMQMIALSNNTVVCDRIMAEQAHELRRVFHKVSNLQTSPRYVVSPIKELGRRKRKLPEPTMLSPAGRLYRKLVKVTPTK